MMTARFDRRGMTLVEIMIAMVVGLIIMTSAMSFTITTFRGVEHTNLREDVFRTGRFIGASLERDAASAGVSIRSQVRFGTLLAKGDTMVIVSVPFDTLPVTAPQSGGPGHCAGVQHAGRHGDAGDAGARQLRHLLRRRQGGQHRGHAAVRRRQHDPDERGQRAPVPERHGQA